MEIYLLLDPPYCKPDQVQVFGVAREETARISCDVFSNPQSNIIFEWRFNTSGEMVDMPHDRFRYIASSFLLSLLLQWLIRTI